MKIPSVDLLAVAAGIVMGLVVVIITRLLTGPDATVIGGAWGSISHRLARDKGAALREFARYLIGLRSGRGAAVLAPPGP